MFYFGLKRLLIEMHSAFFMRRTPLQGMNKGSVYLNLAIELETYLTEGSSALTCGGSRPSDKGGGGGRPDPRTTPLDPALLTDRLC